MELIDDARAFDEGLPSGQDGVPCCIQLTEALTHAHERGVLHLDLKPSNILIDGQHQPHLIDFGAGGMGFNGHRIRSSAGSPRWMAPEQRDPTQTPDARVDVFSVGLVLPPLWPSVMWTRYGTMASTPQIFQTSIEHTLWPRF